MRSPGGRWTVLVCASVALLVSDLQPIPSLVLIFAWGTTVGEVS